ncbi:MAG: hypothetical protein WC722_06775 [Rhodospirillales bacterium]|jgi:hypothetical protein
MMTTLDFIVEMTKAVAWPLAVVSVAIVFKRSLPNLIERVTSLKYGDFEAAFTSQAASVADNISATPSPSPSFVDSNGEKLLSLAQESPRAAILEAWLQIERKLNILADDKHVDASIRRNSTILINTLRETGAISSETERALNGLRQLRNLAVHAPGYELSAQKAIEFVTFSSALLWTMSAPPPAIG